jgi:hypothetical protein
MCLGFGLAQMELTLAIARLAQRLDVSATSAEIPRPFGLIVNRPTGGAVFDVTCDASQPESTDPPVRSAREIDSSTRRPSWL